MPDTDMLDRLIREPVRTDDDVVRLVTAVIERAIRPQCWVLFLDDRGMPIPFLLPIADLPVEPDEHVEDFAALIADVVTQLGAADVVLAWERPDADRLTPADWGWIDACACALDEQSVRLRAQVVVHTGGTAVIEFDEGARALAS
ncbi:hypothetical protein [Curtobacterium oceanosedimentum]|uniref:hypothetical protein n=1 Tax=Curtobacterium oceanosedimentum TaxID=465820 RepID=UPI001CE22F97|nr:hypothetical protein [Curtobacterium oceanosedimentum]MCA5923943.1 hypothetical protein [Curtobacterium oceanosedimentum]